MLENSLIRKLRLIFKLCDVTNWEANNQNAHNAHFNISRSICNQTMKCGQLMEYNTKNIYLEIEYNIRNILLKNQGKNVVETLVRDLFKKTKIKHISGSAV